MKSVKCNCKVQPKSQNNGMDRAAFSSLLLSSREPTASRAKLEWITCIVVAKSLWSLPVSLAYVLSNHLSNTLLLSKFNWPLVWLQVPTIYIFWTKAVLISLKIQGSFFIDTWRDPYLYGGIQFQFTEMVTTMKRNALLLQSASIVSQQKE